MHTVTVPPTTAAARLKVKAILGISDEDWPEACAAIAELSNRDLPLPSEPPAEDGGE